MGIYWDTPIMLWFLKDLSTTKNHQSGLNNHLSWGGSHLNHHPDFSSRPMDFVIKQPQHHLIGVQNCRCNPEKLRVSSTRTAQFIRKKNRNRVLYLFFSWKRNDTPTEAQLPFEASNSHPTRWVRPWRRQPGFHVNYACMYVYMSVCDCVFIYTYIHTFYVYVYITYIYIYHNIYIYICSINKCLDIWNYKLVCIISHVCILCHNSHALPGPILLAMMSIRTTVGMVCVSVPPLWIQVGSLKMWHDFCV